EVRAVPRLEGQSLELVRSQRRIGERRRGLEGLLRQRQEARGAPGFVFRRRDAARAEHLERGIPPRVEPGGAAVVFTAILPGGGARLERGGIRGQRLGRGDGDFAHGRAPTAPRPSWGRRAPPLRASRSPSLRG